MQQYAIEDFFKEYCLALEWAISLVGSLPKHSFRFLEYKAILEKQVEGHRNSPGAKTTDVQKIKPTTEANVEAFVLIDVFRKFSERKDKEFVDKLRESLFGPLYAAEEVRGGGMSRRSFGRDIQSELIIASKFKDPTRVSFSGGDVIYDFLQFKFGFECKRIHSEKNILNEFEKACSQIQNNRDTSFGFVAFRLDKLFYRNEKSGILLPRPMLFPVEDEVIRVGRAEELFRGLKTQADLFHDQFNDVMFKKVVQKKYSKVIGYCVFYYRPFLTGNPVIIRCAGLSVFTLWRPLFLGAQIDPQREMFFSKFINEMDLGEYFQN